MGKTKQKQDRSHYLFSNQELANLIGPLVIEQLLAVFVGMADSIMVANVGEAAVSGVSLVDNIMILIINIFAALATGGAVVAGQYIGRKDEKSACKAATQLVWFVSLSAVAIMILVYFGKDIILNQVFGHITAEVKGHADIYLLIVTASIPFIALYNGGAAIFRAMGNSQVSMRVSLLMNAINVTGNAILVFGLRIGTAGVAIPTLISRMVAAIVITVLLCNQTRILHIERTLKIRFDGRMIRKILAIGVPNGLENSMFQLGKILVLSLVSTFGTCDHLCGNGGNGSTYFPCTSIDFESIQFVRSDSSGSNKYYSFPWNQCNDYLATFICSSSSVSCGRRCKSLYVYIDCVDVDFPDRIQLSGRKIYGTGSIWRVGCNGDRLGSTCNLFCYPVL